MSSLRHWRCNIGFIYNQVSVVILEALKAPFFVPEIKCKAVEFKAVVTHHSGSAFELVSSRV